MNRETTYGIGELARDFDVTTRTIRFYEEAGLLNPSRDGQQRVYTDADRVKLKLILRGKRLGYSLDEIAEMIGMGNFDTDEEQQLKKAYSYGRRKLKEIESRMEELEILKQDLLRVQEKILNRLKQLNLKPPR